MSKQVIQVWEYPEGRRGSIGPDGESAYEVWLADGNDGTVEDYLASLEGDTGAAGKSAYQIWLDEGNTGTEEDYLASLKGEPGTPGQDGILSVRQFREETDADGLITVTFDPPFAGNPVVTGSAENDDAENSVVPVNLTGPATPTQATLKAVRMTFSPVAFAPAEVTVNIIAVPGQPPVISGTAYPGGLLTSNQTGQWQLETAPGTWANIVGQTGLTYAPRVTDCGHKIRQQNSNEIQIDIPGLLIGLDGSIPMTTDQGVTKLPGAWNAPFSLAALVTASAPVGSAPTQAAGSIIFNGTSQALYGMLRMVDQTTLPDASGSTPGVGFTCTGGTFSLDAGTFWASNDGRANINSGTFRASLVQLSLDGREKISEIVMWDKIAGLQSIQGLDFDADGNLWFTSPIQGKIFCVDSSGNVIREANYAGANGMVYDRSTNSIIVGTNGGVFRRIDPLTSVVTQIFPNLSGDQLELMADGQLRLSRDSNSTMFGSIWGLAKGTVADATAYVGTWARLYFIENAGAIEGFRHDGTTVWVLNDGFFHSNTDPLDTNRLQLHRDPNFGDCHVVDFIIAFRMTGVPSQTSPIIGIGDASTGTVGQTTGQTGIGLYALNSGSNTPIRSIVSNAGRGGQRATNTHTPGTAISTLSVIHFRANLTAGIGTMWQNNAQVGSTVDLSTVGNALRAGEIAIAHCDTLSGRWTPCEIKHAAILKDSPTAAANALRAYFIAQNGLS